MEYFIHCRGNREELLELVAEKGEVTRRYNHLEVIVADIDKDFAAKLEKDGYVVEEVNKLELNPQYFFNF